MKKTSLDYLSNLKFQHLGGRARGSTEKEQSNLYGAQEPIQNKNLPLDYKTIQSISELSSVIDTFQEKKYKHTTTIINCNHLGMSKHDYIESHPSPVRIAVIERKGSSMCQWGCRKRENLIYYWGECKLIQLQQKSVQRFLEI